MNESCGETLLHFAESSKGERTDEIFEGDFTKFRGPLDLTKVRGGYSVSVKEVRSSGGSRAVDLRQEDRQIYT
jgi:hypothetical protein